MKTIQHKTFSTKTCNTKITQFTIHNSEIRTSTMKIFQEYPQYIHIRVKKYSKKMQYYIYKRVEVYFYTERTSASGACRCRSVLKEFCKQTNHTSMYICQTQSTHASRLLPEIVNSQSPTSLLVQRWQKGWVDEGAKELLHVQHCSNWYTKTTRLQCIYHNISNQDNSSFLSVVISCSTIPFKQ